MHQRIATADRVHVDLGTGDGRAVLARARDEPATLVIGIDANPASMAEASRRAARSVAKGGLPNTLFALASAEQIPDELRGVADSMTLAFPWGSLLRGALALDEAAAQGIRALLAPAATTAATLSIEDRDRLDLPPLHDAAEQRALADRWSRLGLDMCGLRLATQEELAAMPSTWARRLAAGRDRAAWRLELQARPTGAATIASRDVNRRPR